jgi:hypothetical protein
LLPFSFGFKRNQCRTIDGFIGDSSTNAKQNLPIKPPQLSSSQLHQPLPLFFDRAFAREKLEAAKTNIKKRNKMADPQ